MNAVIETIKRRRTIRSFKPDPVPRAMIEALIEAANWAPSGSNLQRWRFVVVTDPAFRERLVRRTKPLFDRVLGHWAKARDEELGGFFSDLGPRCLGWPRRSKEENLAHLRSLEDAVYWGAPAIIFVIGTASDECAMACQNMMLAATSLGLGSCLASFGGRVTGDAEVVEALGLGENERIYGPVAVGFPEIHPDPPQKRPPTVKWI